MTLREFGQSIVGWWDAYLTEVTTKHVLDWGISHLVLTLFVGLVGLALAAAVAELALSLVLPGLARGWKWVGRGWEMTGVPSIMDRLDKRFGPLITGLIMVPATFVFFIVVFLLLTLLE